MRRLEASVVLILCSAIVCASLWAKVKDKASLRVSIAVDASETPRKIFHVKLDMEAAPGPLTLYYPKWIPGEHGPTGPIADLAGLKITANGSSIPWRRDSADMYAIHCDVPHGASSITIALDYLSPATAAGFSSGASATEKLALLSWNQVLLYPGGYSPNALIYTASLQRPAGWGYGTALPVHSESGGKVEFEPVSLTTLIDSPVLMGEYFRKVPLQETDPKATLDVAADTAAALAITPEHIAHLKSLVAETGELFGARHYRHYDFLLTLSNHTAHFGLEHHESSDDRVAERSLVDEYPRELSAGLLPHEMTHSWNGKYRRPVGLATADYQQPMQGDLLWVYEGLTEYLGQILTARSGLLTPDLYREELALTAAEMDRGRPGRAWRNLEDTAIAAQDLYEVRNSAWLSWRRSVDFYPESELLWLEADTIIRRETQGRKSLDDFCLLFHGGKTGPPEVMTYNLDQVVATMNQVVKYDWHAFFSDRLQSHGPGAPMGGIENSGWKLVYNDVEPHMLHVAEHEREYQDFRFSLGITVKDSGEIPDVILGSPAYEAGIGPGMVLVAVNGRGYHGCEDQVLHDALRAAKSGNQPLELLIRNGDYFKVAKINYHEGDKYPHLERDSGKPDLLGQIIQPLAK